MSNEMDFEGALDSFKYTIINDSVVDGFLNKNEQEAIQFALKLADRIQRKAIISDVQEDMHQQRLVSIQKSELRFWKSLENQDDPYIKEMVMKYQRRVDRLTQSSANNDHTTD